MKAFGAPYSMRMLEIDAAGMYDTAAESLGRVFVTTELGGGGTSTPATVGIARRGLHNFLGHCGIVAGDGGAGRDAVARHAVRATASSSPRTTASSNRWCDLGEPVERGQTLARIYPLGRTGVAPVELRARMDGILAARHFPGLIKCGDCAAVLAAVVD